MLSFLRRTVFLFSEVVRDLCEFCGVSECPSQKPCCLSNGHCQMMTENECKKADGVTINEDDCTLTDCGVDGVCCVDGQGSWKSKDDCADAEGKWLGPDAKLADCKLGACCEVKDGARTGNCQVLSRHDCIKTHKSRYQGIGTNCENRDCTAIGNPVIDSYVLASENACKCGWKDFILDSPGGGFTEEDVDGDVDPSRRWLKQSVAGVRDYWLDEGTPDCIAEPCDQLRDIYSWSGFSYRNLNDHCKEVPGINNRRDYKREEGGDCNSKVAEKVTIHPEDFHPFWSGGVRSEHWSLTPNELTYWRSSECVNLSNDNWSYNVFGSRTWLRYDEDTLFRAIARSQTDPECPRLECDEEGFQGCERCPYDPEATNCWEAQQGDTACTTSISGACYNATAMRLYISLSGGSGGIVYVEFCVYPIGEPENCTTVYKEYHLDPAGPDDATTCIIDDIEAPLGKCVRFVGASTEAPPEPE